MSTETTFNGTIADLRTLMSKLENEHRDGYEYHPNAAPLFFYETFKPGDIEPNPNRAAWNVIPNFTGDDKNYHAGIEVYQVGQQVTIEFIDGYCPRYNEVDGRARGQGVFSDEFEPIGDSFWALVKLIKQRLPGSVAPMAEEPKTSAVSSQEALSKLEKGIIEVVTELQNNYEKITDPIIGARLWDKGIYNPETGEQYVREWINKTKNRLIDNGYLKL